jgi:uncharacterized protein (TIGR01777 family)
MKVFVTGGTGLIGSALVSALLDREASVTVLSRKSNLPDNIKQATNVASLDEVHFSHYDAIINLAGEPIVAKRWSQKQKLKLCHSRWKLTQALSEKIDDEVKQNIRFISGSAVGFYGRQGSDIVDEQFKMPFQEFSHHLCFQWEQLAMQTRKANTAILRTGIVLSNQGGALDKMLLPYKLCLGGPIASGQQYMPWIHIDDMVNGILFLLEHNTANGEFNFTAPTPVTNKQFSDTLAKVLHRPAFVPMPEFVLRMLMGEMADLLVYGQNAIPRNLVKAGFEFKFKELQPALENLLD